MVNEGIFLGHKISEKGIEVDKAKVDAIEKMSCPKCRGYTPRRNPAGLGDSLMTCPDWTTH